MIYIFLNSILACFFHFSIGKIFFSIFGIESKNSFENYLIIALTGLVFISFLSLLVNFFIPLNIFFNSCLVLIGICQLIYYFKKINKKKFLKFIFFCGIFSGLLIFLSDSYRPDSGLYHYPFTNTLIENKIIFGLSNLHTRFGHISIMQYVSAAHNNIFFGLNGIVIPLASIAAYVMIFFLNDLSKIATKNITISDFFSICIVFYFTYKMNRYSEYGNDAPGHFIFFLIISFFLKSFSKKISLDKKDEITFLLSTFSIFVFLNKPTLIFSLLIPIIYNYKFFFTNLISVRKIFLFLLIFLWIVKNVINTGCIIYPIYISCFNFIWSNFYNLNDIKSVSIGMEAWSKDWSNQPEGLIMGYKDFLRNYYWLDFWLQNHFVKILSILLPYIGLLLGLFFIFLFNFKIDYLKLNKIKNSISLLQVFCVVIFGLGVWFVKAPIYRYGYSYIIILISLTFSFIFVKLFNYNKFKLKKICNYIFILSICILCGKQFLRIAKKFDDHYLNYPWPKYYSFSEENYKIKYVPVIKNNKLFYYKPENSLCFYGKSPCTNEEVDENLQMTIVYNYKVFYFNKKYSD